MKHCDLKNTFCLRVYQETTINILFQDNITTVHIFLLLRAVTTIFFPIRLLLDCNIDSTSQLKAYNKKQNKINLFTYINTDNIDLQKLK